MTKVVEVSKPNSTRRRTSFKGALVAFVVVAVLYHAIPRDVHSPSLDAFRRAVLPSETANREQFFLSIPNPESALEASRSYASHPNLGGSPEDFEQAKATLRFFQTHLGVRPSRSLPIFPAGSTQSRQATLGLASLREPSAWMDVYYPVLTTPLGRSVEVLDDAGKVAESLDLREDGDPLDPIAGKFRDAVPAFHGCSHDGEAEGELVYANYGTQEDYDAVEAAGTNMTGKIIICRYGGIFRGLKIKGAQERGAAGVLIYSDTRDDSVTVENGYKPYPHGPARNPTSFQRGTAQAISIYPGDPTTPGYPAYKNATRVEAWNIARIPSLPISWANAQHLLKTIGEGIPRTGDSSSVSIRMVNHVNQTITPIWNVMASIPGHIRNEVVVLGCHRDAWLIGATDPGSAYVGMHEVVKGYSALLKRGWKPLRTILFASWDGEEPGLIGSVEWGEDFQNWISENVMAYLNIDITASGSRWVVASSPSLAPLIRRTAMDVPHPTSPGKTLWDARQDLGPFRAAEDVHTIDEVSDMIPILGSGSDYTVMLQHIGVASADQGFKVAPYDAPYHYHSVYDSQRWQELYADPGFHRHVAVAQNYGLLGLRITDSLVLPINTTHYALELDSWLDNIAGLAANMSLPFDSTCLRDSIGHLQEASAALDVEKAKAERKLRRILRKIPRRRSHVLWRFMLRIVSALGFVVSCDHEAVSEQISWMNPDTLWDHAGATPPHHLPHPIRKLIKAIKRVQRANKKLTSFERGFISEGGIKDREWYKHLGVAPGKWLGYGATAFPGLTEALAVDKNATAAKVESERLVCLIDKLAATIRP